MLDQRKIMELQRLAGVENFRKLTIPQMLERGKLIELLESAESAFYWSSSDKGFIEKIADHLIANDVVPVVRCKDCHYCDPENRHCDHPMGTTFPAPRKPDDFCSYGERKDNES